MQLVGLKGAHAGLTIPLLQETSLGRDASNTVAPTDDSQVSRRHARFLITQSGPVVEDLGSSNGTFVNGSRISAPTPLKQNDVIDIGDLARHRIISGNGLSDLAGGVAAPGPDGPVVLQRERVEGAGGDRRHPGRDLHGLSARGAHADLSVVVGAPAPDRSVGIQGVALLAATRNGDHIVEVDALRLGNRGALASGARAGLSAAVGAPGDNRSGAGRRLRECRGNRRGNDECTHGQHDPSRTMHGRYSVLARSRAGEGWRAWEKC